MGVPDPLFAQIDRPGTRNDPTLSAPILATQLVPLIRRIGSTLFLVLGRSAGTGLAADLVAGYRALLHRRFLGYRRGAVGALSARSDRLRDRNEAVGHDGARARRLLYPGLAAVRAAVTVGGPLRRRGRREQPALSRDEARADFRFLRLGALLRLGPVAGRHVLLMRRVGFFLEILLPEPFRGCRARRLLERDGTVGLLALVGRGVRECGGERDDCGGEAHTFPFVRMGGLLEIAPEDPAFAGRAPAFAQTPVHDRIARFTACVISFISGEAEAPPDRRELLPAERAGARFAVSPGHSPALLDAADDSDLPYLPGASTASEAMTLLERGYHWQKFFPAVPAGGIEFVRALASPLPRVGFCTTGGIGAASAAAWLALPNVVAVGGSWLTPKEIIAAGDWAAVEALAREASVLGRK